MDGSAHASVETSVLLIDESGAVVAGTMTGADGAYLLRAPRPGSYRVRARRVGFAPTTSAGLAIANDAAVNFDPTMRMLPATLAQVNVQESERCVIAPEAGAAALALWEAVQNALSNAAASSMDRNHSFMLTRFHRELHPQTGKVLASTNWKVLVNGSETYRSLPAESLAVTGYIERVGRDSAYYSAPDARTLVSEAFARTHCLRPVAGSRGSVGLAFEPVHLGARADVAGTLWLEQKSGRLQNLQFSYVDSATAMDDSIRAIPRATGRVDYRRLDDGSWIINDWTLRIPTVAYDSPSRRGGRGSDSRESVPYVERLQEFGGNVTEVVMPRRNTPTP